MTDILALDFDETLAPTYSSIVVPWDDFMAAWLVRHGIYKTEEEARASYQFENEYGCGPTYFAKKFGRDVPWVDAFYQAVSPLVLKPALAALEPDPELHQLLKDVRFNGYTLAIISQSHRDYLLPLINHLGLSTFFPPELVIDRAHKRFSPNGYLQLQHLTVGMGAQSYTMADDSSGNLVTAKKCGFRTVHINPKPKFLPEVDTHSPNLKTFLRSLLD